MDFAWKSPGKRLINKHWSDCEELTLAANQFAYLVGREGAQWFALFQDQSRAGEFWLHLADSQAEAKRFAEEHARGRIH